MSWKVVVTARTMHDVGQEAIELLRSNGCEVELPTKLGPFSGEDLLSRVEGYDAVLATVDKYDAAFFASPRVARLKVISRWGVGYDSVDVPAATQAGVPVAYTPGMLNETVADYTWALLLAMTRQVHEGHALMRQGGWRLVWGVDVGGKTLGILGCGRIGLAVARRAAGFGVRLLGFDPNPTDEGRQLGIEYVSLEALLERSDFLTLHCALTPASRGLIGEAQLRRMKKGSFLINAGRGALIDEAALGRALADGHLAGAALDTFTVEPLPGDHPLRSAPNVLLTPHQASFGRETGEAVSLAAAQAILDLKQGRRARWVVDPAVYDAANYRCRP